LQWVPRVNPQGDLDDLVERPNRMNPHTTSRERRQVDEIFLISIWNYDFFGFISERGE